MIRNPLNMISIHRRKRQKGASDIVTRSKEEEKFSKYLYVCNTVKTTIKHDTENNIISQ